MVRLALAAPENVGEDPPPHPLGVGGSRPNTAIGQSPLQIQLLFGMTAQSLVGREGLEPPTPGLKARRSTR